ncbi:MAG: hypothetical protein WAV41_03880 [Microgenomates group bacterium]
MNIRFDPIEKMLSEVNLAFNQRKVVMKKLEGIPLTEGQKDKIDAAEQKIEDKIIKPLEEVLNAVHSN